MSEPMNIQWFPGHMTKAQRMIEENLKIVDAVCEIIDARIPCSSRNPDIDRICGSKPRLIILNRVDQADPKVTVLWRDKYRADGLSVLETDCRSGEGVGAFSASIRLLLKEKIDAYADKGQTGRPLRVMILGIPNVGKSTFINRVSGRKAAKTSDKPGVTRGKQWISIDKGLELLDTPGILWPRFDSQSVGECLAVTGAIRDEIIDRETLAANLMLKLRELYPISIEERYKFTLGPDMTGFELLENAAKKRGFLLTGGEYDLERMSVILLDEFRAGKLGRISLEIPGACYE